MTMRDDPHHPPSEDLFAYRDGELVPEKRALIEAHVMGCSVCRSFIDQVSSLEAELRQSPDRSPSGYLERVHESVRARIAKAGPAAMAEEEEAGFVAPAPRAPRGVIPAWGGRDRRGEGRAGAGEGGRIKTTPRLPWAAVLSTASAAAAVLVVGIILIKQGTYQRAAAPRAPVAVRNDEAGEPSSDTGDFRSGVKSKNDATAQRGTAAGSAEPQKTQPALDLAKKDEAKLEAERRDRLAKAAAVETVAPEEGAEARRAPADANAPLNEVRPYAAPPAAEPAPETAAARKPAAPGAEYEALVSRLGLPPVWDEARVSPEALARAEPELRTFYTSGAAGPDSARVRLYLAEAARLRYAPGNPDLYEEIRHHYRRAIELAGPDSEIARVAEERLKTLEP